MDSTRKKQSRGLCRQLPKRSLDSCREIDHLRFRDQVIDEGIPQVPARCGVSLEAKQSPSETAIYARRQAARRPYLRDKDKIIVDKAAAALLHHRHVREAP